LPTRRALILENLGMSGKREQLHRGTEPRLVDQPAAAAMLIRREAYNAIGGFDERFYPAWYEDVDFCCRLKSAGWEVYFAPEAEFIHEGGYSAKALGPAAFIGAYYRNQLRYAGKHFGGGRQSSIRLSMAAGMAVRMVLRPSGARAYWNVIVGALSAW
jgi:GT2 family glycosyltransferase